VTDLAQEVVGRAITQSHLAAWNTGMRVLGITDDVPRPRGLLVGEAPGPNTDPLLPLFPDPASSAGGRLLKFSGADPAAWLGKLVRMNMCEGSWSTRRAVIGRARALAFLLDERNWWRGRPLRVLLLGTRVSESWGCRGAFGYTDLYGWRDRPLRVAWIPHPSGRNLIYNERRNQLRARRAVLWAMGDRVRP
jgi:hypothetical protein